MLLLRLPLPGFMLEQSIKLNGGQHDERVASQKAGGYRTGTTQALVWLRKDQLP